MESEKEFVELLISLLEERNEQLQEGCFPWIERIETFEERGVLTMDAGFIVTLHDGTEIEVTVTRR